MDQMGSMESLDYVHAIGSMNKDAVDSMDFMETPWRGQKTSAQWG